MTLLHIYGASDDLIEIEGDVSEEFYADSNDAGIVRIQGLYDVLDVYCQYERGGSWLISPLPVEDGPNPDWPMSIAAGQNAPIKAPTYTTVLTVSMPDPVSVTFRRTDK